VAKTDNTAVLVETIIAHFKGDFEGKDVISKDYVIETLESVLTASKKFYEVMEK